MNPAVAVLGNVTLDVICTTVDNVPRHDSLSFERAALSPGGCASNVAIGLAALGTPALLIARVAGGMFFDQVAPFWRRAGVDTRRVVMDETASPAVSVGLVDSQRQPRFIHTSGANARLTVDDVDLAGLVDDGARALHVAGYFVLPGLAGGRLPGLLADTRQRGLITSLDVVNSPRMKDPSSLWPCLPALDVFLCNEVEGERLTGRAAPQEICAVLRQRGARAAIVKMGAEGCWLDADGFAGRIAAEKVAPVVDTTGAGDAFAAGFLAALVKGASLADSCAAGHRAGARVVQALGAIAAWLPG